jgi:Protein of unknown function (DUF2637)
MTAVDPTPPNVELAAAQRRAVARDAYRASLADGVPLTGADLGRQFGLSPRWGRNRVAEVHAEATAGGKGVHATTGDSRERKTADGHEGPDAGPDGVQSDIVDGGAESAWRRSNGAAPPSGDRAASERPHDQKALTDVSATVRGITTVAVVVVAVVAAVASYDHQRALAELAGEDWRAWLLPVSGTALSSPLRCRCSSGAGPGCRRGRSPGHLGSSGSARASPPTLPPLTPRRSGDLSPPGRPSPCCSLGSC